MLNEDNDHLRDQWCCLELLPTTTALPLQDGAAINGFLILSALSRKPLTLNAQP